MADAGRLLFDEAAQARRKQTIAAAAAAVLAVVLAVLAVGKTLQLSLFDAWFRIRGDRQEDPNLVIVALDGKTYAQYPGNAPPRDAYAPLIDRLSAAGATVIGLDVTFGENPRKAEENAILAEAMQRAGNVVFGFNFNDVGQPSRSGTTIPDVLARVAVEPFDDTGLALLTAPSVELPEPVLAEAAAGIGHVNTLVDADGKVRTLLPLIGHGDRYFPALAVQIARVHTGTPLAEVTVRDGKLALAYADLPVSDGAFIFLDWATTDLMSFPTHSMLDVLRGDVPDREFEGRAVLIAATAEGVDDKPFPFGRIAPGVAQHATFVENVFSVRSLHRPSWALAAEWAILGVLALVAILGLPRLRLVPVLLVGAGMVLLPSALSLLLFLQQDLWLQPLYASYGALLPLLVLVAMKSRQTERVVRDVTAEKLDATLDKVLLLQSQGQLLLAQKEIRQLVPALDKVKAVYMGLARDFKNRGDAGNAFQLFKAVQTIDPSFEEVTREMELLRQQGFGTRAFVQPTQVGAVLAAAAEAAADQVVPEMADDPHQPEMAVDPTLDVTISALAGESSAARPAATAAAADDEMDATMAVGAQPTKGLVDADATRGVAMTSPTVTPGRPPATPAAVTGHQPSGSTATAMGAGATATGAALNNSLQSALATGSAFHHYKIEKILGKGGMGEVYKVVDTKIGRPAALKLIRADIDLPPSKKIEMRQRFYREATAAGKLVHPNIVTIYENGEDAEGTAYIVMEFVEGDTLTNLTKNRPLNVKQVKHVIVGAAIGLDYAHQNGVFHRDIKPDNIMVSKAGNVKVMDFGIARLAESDLTQTGSILGTPAYMAPEQLSGKKVDARSDIFSLGVVLYQLLTGLRPFKGNDATQLMLAILQQEPAPPSAVAKVDPVWDPILARALVKDPEKRYPTAREFAQAVQRA